MIPCQPLLDVLIARGIEDIDSFIQPPSWSDLPEPKSIPEMANAADRVLAAVRDKQRIAIFGDYDCDGILGTHILRSVLCAGCQVETCSVEIPPTKRGQSMASITQENSLFEIDRELDTLLDEIEEEIESRGEVSAEMMERFQQFWEAHSEKADRIGRFLRMMEAHVQYCRSEASRLQDRVRSSERKATHTKYMVMYYRKSRELKKIEGREFTLRIQKNSQDSVPLTDETQVPMRYRMVAARLDGAFWERVIESVPEDMRRLLVASIQDASPSNEAIKQAVQSQIAVPGAEAYRGDHLRVA
jgi:hypothetical protein